jgi:DNA-binding NarL/FixJ family response regulator
VKVLLIDDHLMFAQSLARLLDVEPDIDVVGMFGTMLDGVAAATIRRPDVVVVDYRLPDGDGVSAASRITADVADVGVIMLTGMTDEQLVLDAMDAGCAGFVTKDKAASELVHAIRVVHDGDAYLPPKLLAALLPKFSAPRRRIGDDLTDREREVLQLMAEGLTNKDISQRLVVSNFTTRNHVRNILTKLHAHSRLEAVVIANRERVLDRRSSQRVW